MQLNDAANVSQDISFEDKMARYHVQFRNAPDAIKARMLQEINRELDLLTQQNHEDIQDAPQMSSQPLDKVADVSTPVQKLQKRRWIIVLN